MSEELEDDSVAEVRQAQPKRFTMPAGWNITDQKLKDRLASMNRAQRRAWAARPESRRTQ